MIEGIGSLNDLPNNLQQYIQSFDIQTATEIDLSLPGLTPDNMGLFLSELTGKYKAEDDAITKKFMALNFANSPGQAITEKARDCYIQNLEALIKFRMDEVFLDEITRDDKSRHTKRIAKVIRDLNSLYKHAIELDPPKSDWAKTAFQKAAYEQFKYADHDRNIMGAVPIRYDHNHRELYNAFMEYKHDYMLETAKENFAQIGVGKDIDDREEVDVGGGLKTSIINYMVSYSSKHHFIDRRTQQPNVQEGTLQAYNAWVWPLMQEEAIKEFAQKYELDYKQVDFKDEGQKRKFFLSVYGAHYAQSIQNKSVGDVLFFPDNYAGVIHHKEIYQAGFDFLALGAYKSKLPHVKFNSRVPNPALDGMKHDLDAFLDPMLEHVQNGSPLPFTSIEMDHAFSADNAYSKCYQIAKAIADKPADYYKLTTVSLKWKSDDYDFQAYDNFLDQMIALAQRQDNPLRTEIDFPDVNKHYKDKYERAKSLYETLDQPTLEQTRSIERQKALIEKISRYRLLVAQNRRKINYDILINGENNLGKTSGVKIAGGTVREVEDIKEVRACKRSMNLDQALQGAALEQEQEQESEKEKEQEKEQEQEQEQEQNQEQVFGNEEDNITTYEQFDAFVRDQCHFHIGQDKMKRFWHGICGNYQVENGSYVQNPQIKAISKEAVATLLRDPEAFQNGFINGNMPKGYHIGLLATANGPQKGIFFDPSIPDKHPQNPLTIDFSDPVPTRPRMKAESDHFNVRDNLSTGQRMAVGALGRLPGVDLDEMVSPPTEDEIERYNSGHLFGQDGWVVAGKMAFCTCPNKTVFQYRAWANDPITRAMIVAVEPQEVAEQAVALGGQAIFDLTDKLNKVKKRCKKAGQEELFDTFMDNFILQKDNEGWFEKPRFCDHIIRHCQFKGMEEMVKLEDPDFTFFIHFVNQHAKYHSKPDLNELYNSFIYFKNRFEEIAPGQELPIENIEAFAQSCTDMKVGMNRMLVLLENAKQHDLLNEQLAVITQLSLDYPTAYSAVANHHYHIITPEMQINLEHLKTGLLTSKADLSALQTAYFYNHWFLEQAPGPIKVEFHRQFGLAETAPSMEKFKALEHFINEIKGPEYQHPELIKSFMYTVSGFCCYHAKGIDDVDNTEKLARLAKAVDGLNLSDGPTRKAYAAFINQINECQISHSTGGPGYQPPTLDSLHSTITLFNRLAPHFGHISPQRQVINKALNITDFYDHDNAFFEHLHHFETKLAQPGDKLTDAQLANALVQLEELSKRQDQIEDKPTERFANIQGGLLHLFTLMGQPNDNFVNDKHDNQSLAHFLDEVKKDICSSESNHEHLGFVLDVLGHLKWDQLQSPYPTFEQVRQLVIAASKEPFIKHEHAAQWVKSQPGFNGLSFDLSSVEPAQIAAAGFNETFLSQAPKIIQAIQTHYPLVDLDQGRFLSFADCLKHIEELDLEGDDVKFKAEILPLLKGTLYHATQGCKSHIPDSILTDKFSDKEKEMLFAIVDNHYPFEHQQPSNLNELENELTKTLSYQTDVKALYKALDEAKGHLGRRFNQLTTLLAENDCSPIPSQKLSAILHTLNSDAESSQVYAMDLLKTITTFPRKADIADKWELVNQIIQNQLLLKADIDKAKALSLVLNLAVGNTLSAPDITKLLALVESNKPLYDTFVDSFNKQLEAGQAVRVGPIAEKVKAMVEETIPPEVLSEFLADDIHIQLVDKVHAIESVNKKKAILMILTRAHQQQVSKEQLEAFVDNLVKLDEPALDKLAKLDIDAQYPNVTALNQAAIRLDNEQGYTVEGYITDLQKEFFEAKNDPQNLKRLFSDDRVVDVLNQSQNLQFAEGLGLSTERKEKLLSDYAYIHAIGLDKPVYQGKALKDLSKGELKTLKDSLKDTIQNEQATDQVRHVAMLQMLALSREVYYRSTLPDGRFPYSTQILSVLTALDNGKLNINEIATGQGKSLTAALYATAMWAKGQPVTVCTSNLTLASEGLEENGKYYEYMGIPTALIRAGSAGEDFKQDGINYTDVSNMALFLAKTQIQGTFDVDKPGLILDEVDFTVLDEVTDFRYAVNLDASSMSSDVNMDEWFYYKLNEFVNRPEFLDKLVDRESDVANAIVFLKEQLELEQSQGDLDPSVKEYLQGRITDFQAPSSEARKQLDTWIDSAFNAKIIYEQGRNKAWTMEQYVHKDGQTYSAARIISHHRVAKGSKWSKGVHQFLHARINQNQDPLEPMPPCRVDSEKAHVAALSSKNFVDFFKQRGGSIWGMTGTIGTAQERAELQKRYGFKLAKIETHQQRTATREQNAIFVNGPSSHVKAVFAHVERQSLRAHQMPTVIFEENALQASLFKTSFFERLQSKTGQYHPPPDFQFYNGVDYEFYQFIGGEYVLADSHEFDGMSTEAKEDIIKQRAGLQNTITITTPMMGRGTDFKPKMRERDDQNRQPDHPDGLFVIQAYAEGSQREERQIEGRMGRQGKKGHYVNIVDTKRFVDKLKDYKIQVPKSVFGFKQDTLVGGLDQYKLSSNLSLAEERRLKQTFGDIRGHFYQNFIGLMGLGNPDGRFKELKFILEDNETFNEQQFLKDYNQFLLKSWNKFLINIDKEFVRLKDEHNGDYEKIFPELQAYCKHQWNEKLLNSLKHNMGLDDEAIKQHADAVFSEFQQFTDHEINQYATMMHHRKIYGEERDKLLTEREHRGAIKTMAATAMKEAIAFTDDPEEKQMLEFASNNDGILEQFADRVFPDHQKEKLAKARFEQLQSDETIDYLKDIIKPEQYAQEFYTHNFSAKMEAILENGRMAKSMSPDLAVRHDIHRDFINYTKHFWLKDKQALASSSHPKQEIAHMLAVDTLNALVELNDLVLHEKRVAITPVSLYEILDVSPVSENPTLAKQQLLDKIKENPTGCHTKLQQAYAKLSIEAQMRCLEDGLESRAYAKLFEQYEKGTIHFLNGLSDVAFDRDYVAEFKDQLATTIKMSHANVIRDLSLQTRRTAPEKAMFYQTQNPNVGFAPYRQIDIVKDITFDIQTYLNDKSKMQKRKTAAKQLLKDIQSAPTHKDMLECLLKARKSAIDTDISKTSFFRTRNKKGSRFQEVLNRALMRVVMSAQSEDEMLLCADYLRKEMAYQFEYWEKTTSLKHEAFANVIKMLGYEDVNNPTTMSLKELDEMVNRLQALSTDLHTNVNLSQVPSSKIAVSLIDNNLKVLSALRDKMQSKGLDLSSQAPVIISQTNQPREDLAQKLAQEVSQGQWPAYTKQQWNVLLKNQHTMHVLSEYQKAQTAHLPFDETIYGEAPTIDQVVGDVQNVTAPMLGQIVKHCHNIALWEQYLSTADTINPQASLESLLGEKRLPTTAIDYLKIQLGMTQTANLLIDPDRAQERMRMFSSGTLSMPDKLLGLNANQFQLSGLAFYGLSPDGWGPPLSEQGVTKVYEAFERVDEELTSNPQWQAFWHSQRGNLIAQKRQTLDPQALADFDENAFIASCQQEVLAAYRLKVIASTQFQVRLSHETQAEYRLREARAKNLIHDISKMKMKVSAKSCSEQLISRHENDLRETVQVQMQKIQLAIEQGKPLGMILSTLNEVVPRVYARNSREFLGDKANPILEPLKQKQAQLDRLQMMLDQSLDAIAEQFVPKGEAQDHVRVIEMIGIYAKQIIESPTYKALGPHGEAILKAHLCDKESIQRVYAKALEVRTAHFAKMMPDKMDDLLTSEAKGIPWVTYPRARRELMTNLAQVILNDKDKYPQPSLLQRGLGHSMSEIALEHYTKLQQAYLESIEEDLKNCTKAEGKILLKRLHTDPMLQACPGLAKKQRQEWDLKVSTLMQGWRSDNELKLDMGEPQMPDMFGKNSHTGVNVSMGLLTELEKVLHESDESLQQIEAQRELDERIKLVEKQFYQKPQSHTTRDITRMIQDETQHQRVRQILMNIQDHDERLGQIQAVFDNLYKLHDNQVSDKPEVIKALKQLQTMAVDTICAQVIARANQSQNIVGSDVLPDHMSDEVKSELYHEIIGPGLTKQMFNTGDTGDHEQFMKNKLHEISHAVSDIGLEANERVQGQRRDMRGGGMM